METATGIASLLCYLGIALWQGHAFLKGNKVHSLVLIAVSFVAINLHAISVALLIHPHEGINLGFFQVSSLIFWVICLLLWISNFRLPVGNLNIIIYPLSALSIANSLAFTSEHNLTVTIEISMHILVSLLAYSLLTVACIQAFALGVQDKMLRNKHFQGFMRVIPPLQTMEKLLFQILWAGMVLLTLSIVSGFLFFDNMAEQHLAHKMFFSCVAWLIYAILLWGHHRHGWRGKKAIRWATGGFIALMLAYFGSKFVLELLLS
ncbi:MAG: cytochrome c biogenesis protein CcsA [Pseudomonadales bacterium]|nr:cytochrome c biogenesis protein CcsA [Pseudomonadales bacterium]